MLLINGAIAFIGVLVAALVLQLKMAYDLDGSLLAITVFFGLWIYLFLADVVEDQIIKRFNP